MKQTKFYSNGKKEEIQRKDEMSFIEKAKRKKEHPISKKTNYNQAHKAPSSKAQGAKISY